MIAVKMIYMNYYNKNSNCLKDFLKDFFSKEQNDMRDNYGIIN